MLDAALHALTLILDPLRLGIMLGGVLLGLALALVLVGRRHKRRSRGRMDIGFWFRFSKNTAVDGFVRSLPNTLVRARRGSWISSDGCAVAGARGRGGRWFRSGGRAGRA